jgi:acyl carrier protein
MSDRRTDIIADLRAILTELSRRLGNDAVVLGDTDIIPDAGALDSAGLLEFVVQIDEKYTLALEPEDMTIDRLGSLAAIADLVIERSPPGRA